MQKNGSDFTNTFRTLSMITSSTEWDESDHLAVDLLVSYSAPDVAKHIKKKPKYSG